MTSILVLHPGAMGASLVGCLANHHEVICCSAGRSERSLDRARSAGAVLVGELQNAVEEADVVVSIYPPDAAVAVAKAVGRLGFSGLYLDANAISPAALFDRSPLEAMAIDGDIGAGSALKMEYAGWTKDHRRCCWPYRRSHRAPAWPTCCMTNGSAHSPTPQSG